MTLSRIEEQLAALEPVPDDALAERILCAAEVRQSPLPLPTSIFAQVAQPTQHTSCFASGLPILTGIAGGLIGAAVMFFAVTFFIPPRVEIREIVRFVPEVSVDVPVETAPEIKPTVPEPKVLQPVEPQTRPQEVQKLPWVLAWLSPIFNRDAVADLRTADMMHDLDAMIEQRARLSKNAANMEPRPQFVRLERENSPPSKFSPIHYREMIDKMSL